MKKQTKRILSVLLSFVMVLGMLPVSVGAAYDEEGTTYVRVNSVDEIVPNARYVIVGEYEAEGIETNYFAMSTSVNTYDDIRVGLNPMTYTDETQPNFTLSEDKQTLTLHSESILKVRLRSARYGSHENLYRMEVDGQGFLYGCCYSYTYYHTSCCRELPILKNTYGMTWWHFRMGANNYWQIDSFKDYNTTDAVTLVFNDAYGDFMSYCYANNVRLDGDEYFFDSYITQDRDTNIWLYREVCTHKASDVKHTAAVAASCTAAGNTEYWFCAGCEAYSSKADFSDRIGIADTFIAPTGHTESCGHALEQARFELCTDPPSSSNQTGERYLVIGKAGDKYYAMGNTTYADGTRNAVEVMPNENGIVTAASNQAEFLTFYWPENGAIGFTVDGSYFSALDGKIIAYDTALEGTNAYIPDPADFSADWEGLGYFWANSSRDPINEYIVFDADALRFKAQSTREDTIYLYRELCPHTNMEHVPGADATCTEQGAEEYWFCEDCYCYFMDHNFEKPVEIYSESELTKLATGHRFVDGVCANCGMKRHVYTQVSTLEQFDALSKEASYIIVFKDGNTTYAASLPEMEYPCDADENANGILDFAEIDTNANGIPDCAESYIDTNWGGADANEGGVTTGEEYAEIIGDYECDGDVDTDDFQMFAQEQVHWDLHTAYEELAMQAPNFTEVSVAADGSITVTDEGAMEFRMVEGGVWGSQPNEDWMLEENGIEETDRLRAAWVPNYWVGASGQMGYYGEDHFMTQGRFYGDGEYPGIMDHKNWKISFREDGTACLVNSWSDLEDSAALQLAKYGEDKMTIVGLTEWLWGDSEIMLSRTALLPAYLYASEPVFDAPSHTCSWGGWVADENGRTHTRICTDVTCGNKETKEHNWGEGVETVPPGCSAEGEMRYTCVDCSATKTEPVVPVGHSWGEWTDSGNGEAHSRTCECEGCDARQVSVHEWTPGMDENEGKHVCAECGAAQSHSWESNVTQAPCCIAEGEGNRTCTVCFVSEMFTMPIDGDAHSWGEWQEVTPPSEGAEGEEQRVCAWAPETHVQTRPIPALEHEHTYTDWEPYNSATHRQTCMDENCPAFTEEEHSLAEEVIQSPDYGIPGQKRVYCQTCWYECFEEMPALVCQEPVGNTVTSIAATVTINDTAVSIVAAEVQVPAQEPVSDYDKYVLNSMDGYLVDTVYDVSPKDAASGEDVELGENESATVTLYIGVENALKLLNRELLLVHVADTYRKVYQLIELDIDEELGTVSFETDGFSPFVLAAPPAELTVSADAKTVSGGCSVTVSANASFVCNLYAAAYDADGKLLGFKAVSNCNLSSEQELTLAFSGTASCVKTFMMESGGFAPRCIAVEDHDLSK